MSTISRPRTGADCAFFEAFTSQPKDVKAGFVVVMSFSSTCERQRTSIANIQEQE